MAATADLALLPDIRPVVVEVSNHTPSSYQRPRSFQRPSVHRLPPREKTNRISYGPSGYHTLLQDDKGRVIDLYA